ncbi:hypothetical protein BD780_002719 [Clostridium tetanomorphum]|uniref:Zinc-finger domain-containing protein n=1 Tax=Clostridium tetanomorphum TaxID=1553 RepID=A0A923EBZ1_CLOTT|nr:hypothetical protein [Clostridium tetanomorphum]KAJ50591.1 hypothetical protein CTM_16642 [Clostridium tetanomorphum DSM 665]MBC2399052.1 hypothetical protein [Clostridium tetanomorphum]MBP1862665.1 hypothetical protein [Clostridium tetanomorphum]NRS85494.1 hypothetical protein [Clostridium tetanomorphum]NRZ98608.1 hypothetical protein [Clostridium tetanomorphum]
MKCKEAIEKLDMYTIEEINSGNIDDDIKKHIDKCSHCKGYIELLNKTRTVIGDLKESQLKQYETIKMDNREFNNEIWQKIRQANNKKKHFTFVWIEVVIAVLLTIISLIKPQLVSSEIIKFFTVILMIFGMIYTNYKEVEFDE